MLAIPIPIKWFKRFVFNQIFIYFPCLIKEKMYFHEKQRQIFYFLTSILIFIYVSGFRKAILRVQVHFVIAIV